MDDALVEGEIVSGRTSPGELRRSHWNGPLPPPAALAAYNEIDASFAERIVRAYERTIEIAERREQTINESVDAQIEMQADLTGADIALTKRGQWMLYSIAVLALAAAAWFAHQGMAIAAICSVIVSVLTVATNLVTTVRAAELGKKPRGDSTDE